MPPARSRLNACDKVGGERARSGGRRGNARAHHRERDNEGHEVNAERLVGIERGASGPRILRDQLKIAEGGHHRYDERHQERQPHDTADLLGDLAGKRIDAGAEDVADDEQQQQPGAHHAFESRLERFSRLAADGHVRHRSPSRRRHQEKNGCLIVSHGPTGAQWACSGVTLPPGRACIDLGGPYPPAVESCFYPQLQTVHISSKVRWELSRGRLRCDDCNMPATVPPRQACVTRAVHVIAWPTRKS